MMTTESMAKETVQNEGNDPCGIRRAMLSVSDKTGIVDFARGLIDRGVEILSTGGTARVLREAGLQIKEISDFTGFPEILDGRVKTLHPSVHAGLLHVRDNESHRAAMREHSLQPIDLLCVNLYPFEATVARPDVSWEEAIENIDIGGPAMLRSAAKNMRDVTVVCDPSDYTRVLEELEQGGRTSVALRKELALKVFVRVAQYNSAIASFLSDRATVAETGQTPPLLLYYPSGESLRYGENPHQSARFYREPRNNGVAIAHTEVLHGKEMSYNNYVDGNAALEAVRELHDTPAVAIIKHTNPCGFATGSSLEKAFEAAWSGDPVSAFGSVIAVTRSVDLATAQRLSGRFVEVLIAPDFDADAYDLLVQRKNIRLLKLSSPVVASSSDRCIQQVSGGLLVQDKDTGLMQEWTVPTKLDFPTSTRVLAEFGIKACKHVKSNAIVIVREYEPGQYMVLGMGAGQPNRVDAIRKLAVPKAHENIAALHEKSEEEGSTIAASERQHMADCVLISDAFFPFPDNIEAAAEAGLRYIVQPGGSKKDTDVIAACDQLGVAMALTGMRHFKH